MKRLLRIAKPCPASWEAMSGGGTSRHCATCDKSVHDLETMDADTVARLAAGGRACVRVRKTAVVSVAAASVVFAMSMACGPSVADEGNDPTVVGAPPVAVAVDPEAAEAGAAPEPEYLMGDVDFQQ